VYGVCVVLCCVVLCGVPVTASARSDPREFCSRGSESIQIAMLIRMRPSRTRDADTYSTALYSLESLLQTAGKSGRPKFKAVVWTVISA
jgi:hypothetical protein